MYLLTTFCSSSPVSSFLSSFFPCHLSPLNLLLIFFNLFLETSSGHAVFWQDLHGGEGQTHTHREKHTAVDGPDPIPGLQLHQPKRNRQIDLLAVTLVPGWHVVVWTLEDDDDCAKTAVFGISVIFYGASFVCFLWSFVRSDVVFCLSAHSRCFL